ncbi:MAG: protein NosL [Myxococcota bacterium]
MARPEWRRVAASAGMVALLVLAVGAAVTLSARPPGGPVDVDWDGTACARCGMLVSDPAFAGQLHLADGDVRHYDDPGCLLADLAELAELATPEVHAAWLHHHREERWLPLEEAAFAPVDHSPMGYGLAAVAAGDPAGTIPLHAAKQRFAGDAGDAHAPAADARAHHAGHGEAAP